MLVDTLAARDQRTADHSRAVALYAREIAAELGLSEREQELSHLCGLVHDLGKTGLPPGLLEQTTALTPEEQRQMQEHAVIGERILAQVESYADIAKIVRHHHECWDGQGYPDGLRGGEIPMLARIVSVASAFERQAQAPQPAIEEIRARAGTQFDPTVVAALDRIASETPELFGAK
jgi:putative nucleotidyltransferase with HDIG domain